MPVSPTALTFSYARLTIPSGLDACLKKDKENRARKIKSLFDVPTPKPPLQLHIDTEVEASSITTTPGKSEPLERSIRSTPWTETIATSCDGLALGASAVSVSPSLKSSKSKPESKFVKRLEEQEKLRAERKLLLAAQKAEKARKIEEEEHIRAESQLKEEQERSKLLKLEKRRQKAEEEEITKQRKQNLVDGLFYERKFRLYYHGILRWRQRLVAHKMCKSRADAAFSHTISKSCWSQWRHLYALRVSQRETQASEHYVMKLQQTHLARFRQVVNMRLGYQKYGDYALRKYWMQKWRAAIAVAKFDNECFEVRSAQKVEAFAQRYCGRNPNAKTIKH